VFICGLHTQRLPRELQMTNDPRQLSNFYSAWTSAADTDGAVPWARRTEGDEGSTERNRKNGGEKHN